MESDSIRSNMSTTYTDTIEKIQDSIVDGLHRSCDDIDTKIVEDVCTPYCSNDNVLLVNDTSNRHNSTNCHIVVDQIRVNDTQDTAACQNLFNSNITHSGNSLKSHPVECINEDVDILSTLELSSSQVLNDSAALNNSPISSCPFVTLGDNLNTYHPDQGINTLLDTNNQVVVQNSLQECNHLVLHLPSHNINLPNNLNKINTELFPENNISLITATRQSSQKTKRVYEKKSNKATMIERDLDSSALSSKSQRPIRACRLSACYEKEQTNVENNQQLSCNEDTSPCGTVDITEMECVPDNCLTHLTQTKRQRHKGSHLETETQTLNGSKIQKKRRKIITKEKDASEMTLWDLVMKNKRILTKEEIESRRELKKSEQDYIKDEQDNILNDLFSKSPSNDIDSGLFSLSTPADPLGDLFGNSDPLVSKDLSSSLQLDMEGNLLFEDPVKMLHNDTDTGSLMTLLEGRAVVSENYSDTRLVQPFSGAYKHTKKAKWLPKDEKKFYEAIEIFGLDLMMVKTFLPNHTVKQIRDKYRLEEKKKNNKIDIALQRRRPITISSFEDIHGTIDSSTHFHPEDSDNENGIFSNFCHKKKLELEQEHFNSNCLLKCDDALAGLLDIGEDITEVSDNVVAETNQNYPFHSDSNGETVLHSFENSNYDNTLQQSAEDSSLASLLGF